jgi:hypothetical protein
VTLVEPIGTVIDLEMAVREDAAGALAADPR